MLVDIDDLIERCGCLLLCLLPEELLEHARSFFVLGFHVLDEIIQILLLAIVLVKIYEHTHTLHDPGVVHAEEEGGEYKQHKKLNIK